MIPQKLMTIGPYDCYSLNSGKFKLDGGAMFGNVPKILWNKHHPADDNNQIEMVTRNLLLKSKDKVILIDVGNGEDFVPKYGDRLGSKFAQIFAIDEAHPNLATQLKHLNLSANDVTDVILTHLHFDHAGGGVCFDSHTQSLAPSFPKATYWVQEENYHHAMTPNLREKASYLPQNITPLVEAGVLKLLKGAQLPWDQWIEFKMSHGHTVGQQGVKVSDSKQTLFYCADVIPMKSHLQPAWTMSYDINPIKVIDEKIEILVAASKGQWTLFFEHDPKCIGAQIKFEIGDKKPQIINELNETE